MRFISLNVWWDFALYWFEIISICLSVFTLSLYFCFIVVFCTAEAICQLMHRISQFSENESSVIWISDESFQWFIKENFHKSVVLSDQHFKTQRYSICNNVKLWKTANSLIWEHGTTEHFSFLPDERLKMINQLSDLLPIHFLLVDCSKSVQHDRLIGKSSNTKEIWPAAS